MCITRSLSLSALRLGVALALPLLFAGCMADSVADESAVESAVEVGETQQFVVGGTEITDCQWPSTVRIEPSQCTGTLIHPRVVTTAAHCMSGTNQMVGFGTRGAPGSFSISARCVAGARGSAGGNTGRDWAYCILPEDPRIAKLPVTPPLVGCEAALMKPGSSAWVVGFGSTTARGRAGVKRHVEVKVNQFNKLAPGTIDVGDRQVGACHGDSGGPLYFRVVRDGVDYGLRTAGSTSGAGGPCDCTCSTTYVNIDNHVKAIEKNEGIDVTPCTDANGNWDPSPACSGFESAPEKGTGTFPECTVARIASAVESCGPAGVTASDGGTPTAPRDAGSDAGARGDAGVRADSGAADAGVSANDAAGAPVLDASSPGAPRARDAAADSGAARDASAPRDASRRPEKDEEEDEERDEERDEEEDRNYSGSDSGCSARGSSGAPGALGLSVLLLARGVRRRRKRG